MYFKLNFKNMNSQQINLFNRYKHFKTFKIFSLSTKNARSIAIPQVQFIITLTSRYKHIVHIEFFISKSSQFTFISRFLSLLVIQFVSLHLLKKALHNTVKVVKGFKAFAPIAFRSMWCKHGTDTFCSLEIRKIIKVKLGKSTFCVCEKTS